MTTETRYDVAIVGASIAGCTAATLLARRGARVALLERHSDPAAFKTICTHFIQSSALPTIERLGVDGEIYALGGRRTSAEIWTRWGWIRPPAPEPPLPPHGLNVRRKVLDPLLRRAAASSDGVDLLAGLTVDGLVRERGRIAGVEARSRAGERRHIAARLVVGADGRSSSVAELAGIRARVRPNARTGWWAYYRDLPLASGDRAQLWFLEPEVAYAFPTDGGLTLLACMVMKKQLPAFKEDREAGFEGFMRALPDAPPIDGAQRVSKVLGKLDTPNHSRPAAARGVALVGDAALGSDPLYGVGCGFAFQSAEWLADCVADAALGRTDLERALQSYRRRHRAGLLLHHQVISDYSSGRRFNALERVILSAAARDERCAAHADAFATRNLPIRRVASPRALGRAVAVNVRHGLRARRGAPAPVVERPA